MKLEQRFFTLLQGFKRQEKVYFSLILLIILKYVAKITIFQQKAYLCTMNNEKNIFSV